MPTTTSTNIILFIIVLTVLLVLISFSIVAYVNLYNNRKKQFWMEKQQMTQEFESALLKSQIEVQEATLETLGRELHDNIGQLLSTTKMFMAISERGMEHPSDPFLSAQSTLSDAISELRTLTKSLDREWLEQFNFEENLQKEIDRLKRSQVIEIGAEFKAPSLNLSPDNQVILFRIVQEVIQNAIKHAEASHIYIKVFQIQGSIKLSIQDNGKGFVLGEVDNGMGLRNIKNRTDALKGSVEWNSNTPSGTIVNLEIPNN